MACLRQHVRVAEIEAGRAPGMINDRRADLVRLRRENRTLRVEREILKGATYGYDAAANGTSTTLPAGNGYAESRTYDRDGRLTEVRNQKGATVLSRSTYTLDPAGNRLTTQTTTETVNYAYDRLDRLTEACYTPTCTGGTDPFRRYTYDPVGNRLTEARSAGTTTYTYNELDELTQTTGFGGTVNSSYDLDGQTLTAGSASFSWSRQGWLASRSQSGATTTYSYDGDGLRFEASTGSQASKKTQLDWDPLAGVAQLVAERNGSGSLLRRYVNGHDAISVTAGNKTAYLQYDGLGSVVNLTSSTGATWWTYSYLPYGGVRTETKNSTQAIDNTLRFAGEYLDPTGLYYLRAREYDPAAGRFISSDLVRPPVTDPFIAAYVYARNNPVRMTDPSGRFTVSVCLSISLSFFGVFGVELTPVCLVAASSLQVGIASAGGGGGGAGAKASVGLVAQVSSGDYVEDLAKSFTNIGGSAAAGVGVQGGGFFGTGRCGQPVGGVGLGPSLGGGAEGHITETYTQVWGTFGAEPPPCPKSQK